jgi:hypothetical protein
VFKDRRSSKVSVLDRMSRLRVASLAIVMEPPPFFDFPPRMLISGDHHREKTISRQTNLKVMDLFDIRAARNRQDFKDTFILLILRLLLSTNLNFSPFCQLHFPRHMCMSKYVPSTLKASILWQLSSKELLRNLSLPIYQILDAKYLTLQLLG